MNNIELLRKFIIEAIEEEFQEEIEESGHPAQYDAEEGTKRAEQLTQAQKLYNQGDIARAAALRADMEGV